MSSGLFAKGRTQQENLRAVLKDIFSNGNEACTLPGEPEAKAALETKEAGGLLFTAAEIAEFNVFAKECGREPWDTDQFPRWPRELA